MTTSPLIFCAIDTPDMSRAIELTRAIAPVAGGIKLGMEFFNSFGPQGIEQIMESAPSAQYFIDLKFHDIPNTVAATVKSVSSNLNPAYLNVHAAGGLEMMVAAKAACANGTNLLAVTVLTSIDDETLRDIGQATPAQDQVKRLAILTQKAGLDGVVCSSLEIETLRIACGNNFTLMVPGIRPAGSDAGDQKRVMTPTLALEKGATHLVIGRPITGADDPAQAAANILNEISK